jgi:hypothetical protein
MTMRTRRFGKEVKESKGTGDELTTIRGIVIPVDWDEDGNVLATAISSQDEHEYFVELDKKGEKMLGLIRRGIEVRGVVRKIIKGRKTITVKSYRLKTRDDW